MKLPLPFLHNYVHSPEKYPGQRTRYRKFCWKGDGVRPRVTRQMKRLLARNQRKLQRSRKGL